MMRLADLSPHWIGLSGWSSDSKFYVGVSFLCPHCDPSLPEHGPNRRRRLAVMFWPPIDPDGMLGRVFDLPYNGGHHRMNGESFNDLTLLPSVGFDSIGHWHGMVTNGTCK